MRRKNTEILGLIVKHKEYFDQKLIDMVGELNETVKNVSKEKTRVQCQNNRLVFTNRSLNIKISDLKTQNSILKIQCAKEKAEKDDLLKEIQRIQEELEKLQREAELQRVEIEKQRKEIERQDKEKSKDKIKSLINTNISIQQIPICHHLSMCFLIQKRKHLQIQESQQIENVADRNIINCTKARSRQIQTASSVKK